MITKLPADLQVNANGRKNDSGGLPMQFVVANSNDSNVESDSRLPILALLSALRRRWLVALPIGICLGLAAAAAAWAFFVPQYTASAYLKVSAVDERLIFETAEMQVRGNVDFRLFKNTQIQLLKTPFVLNKALNDPAVASLPEVAVQEDPLNWLRKKVEITFDEGEIMQVSVPSPDRDSCITLVNSVVNAYMREVVDTEQKERRQRLEMIRKIGSDAEEELRVKNKELEALANVLGTADAESSSLLQQNAVQNFAAWESQLRDISFQLMTAAGDYQVALNMRDKIAKSFEDRTNSISNRDVEKSPEVIHDEDMLAALLSKLESYKENYGEGHPSVRSVMKEVELMREQLARHEAEWKRRNESAKELQTSQVAFTSSPHTLEQERELLELAKRIEVLEDQKATYERRLNDIAIEAKQLGKSSIELELTRAKIESLQAIGSQVQEELHKASIEVDHPSRIRLISEARTASPPDIGKRIARTAALGIMGLFAPLGLLVIWDLSRKQVDNVEAVNQTLSLQTLGTIPIVTRDPFRGRSGNCSKRELRERMDLGESVDAIASLIMHRAKLEKRKVIMISSAIASEGKSTVACLLSQRLVAAGKRVVLVDFDLRRPTINRYLELDLAPGVADVLHGRELWSNALQHYGTGNLHVLAAGAREGQLSERLTSGTVEQLFQNLRSCYDFVIVDSCPVLPVVDSRIVGQFCDGVVLTLIRDHSRLPMAARACEILKSYGISVLGTVLIGGRSTSADYYYDTRPEVKPTHRITSRS